MTPCWLLFYTHALLPSWITLVPIAVYLRLRTHTFYFLVLIPTRTFVLYGVPGITHCPVGWLFVPDSHAPSHTVTPPPTCTVGWLVGCYVTYTRVCCLRYRTPVGLPCPCCPTPHILPLHAVATHFVYILFFGWPHTHDSPHLPPSPPHTATRIYRICRRYIDRRYAMYGCCGRYRRSPPPPSPLRPGDSHIPLPTHTPLPPLDVAAARSRATHLLPRLRFPLCGSRVWDRTARMPTLPHLHTFYSYSSPPHTPTPHHTTHPTARRRPLPPPAVAALPTRLPHGYLT